MSFRQLNEGRLEGGSRSFLDPIEPTSPDPVELVRQYEEDEQLARVIQECQTPPSVERDNLIEESVRIARQLQAEFDSERIRRLVSPFAITDQPQRNRQETAESRDGEMHDGESRHEEDDISQDSDIDLDEYDDDDERDDADEEEEEEDEEEEDDDDELDEAEEEEDELDETEEDAVDEIVEGSGVEVEEDGDNRQRLAPSEINRLPTRTHSVRASSKKAAECDKECQVCTEKYLNGDELRILPCFHEFHKSCIDPWLLSATTCPVCRVKVDFSERAGY